MEASNTQHKPDPVEGAIEEKKMIPGGWNKQRGTNNTHSISNRKFCCFSFMIAMVPQNSPTVEFWQEKIEGKLRRANTEPSVDFRRANTEPSVVLRKANTEPSVHFRRANTETY